MLFPILNVNDQLYRLNPLTDDDASQSENRIESLSNFQFNALNHALGFPKVTAVY